MVKVATALKYPAALTGIVAVLSFLVLPVVQKTILWIGASRNGAWLIQRVLSSHNAEGITVGVMLITALLAAAAGSFLLLVNHLRRGLNLSLVAFALMAFLLVYFVAETGSSNGLAVGFWISFLALGFMAALSLGVCLHSGEAPIARWHAYRRVLHLRSPRPVRSSRSGPQEAAEEQVKAG